jgi:hypothetical protein
MTDVTEHVPPRREIEKRYPLKQFSPFISKSKYLNGLQCHKLLWFYYNAKDQIPAFDAQTQAIFDQGHLVGELAKKLYPNGIEIAGAANDFGKMLALSKEALSQRRPLFEAAFKSGNAFARADILNPVGKNDWEIIEVKSSTEVKDVNLHDLALQRYAYEGAGLSITKCFILHINNEYVRKGEVEPKKLFTKTDVTNEVGDLLRSVPSNLRIMQEVIRQKNFPEIEIGPHCNDPYGCPLQELCWKFLPEDSPLTLYYFKKEKAFELIHDGHLDVRKLPSSVNLGDKQQIQVDALQIRKPHTDKEGIREFLERIEYPLYYLDFETFGTAIPLYDDVRPYEQIPFQYSLHIVDAEGKQPRHESYLADGKGDPRPEILKKLKRLLGDHGSIVVYNAPFEKDKLKKASDVFAEYAKWYQSIEQRFVDLLTPFKSFHYYHPDQHGSASIKAVLPALTGKSYEGLEIAEGGTASLEYLRVTYGDVDEKERQKVRRQLEKYCALDTEGMAMILESLGRLSR